MSKINVALRAEIISVKPKDDIHAVNNDHLVFIDDNGNGCITVNVLVPDDQLYCIKFYGCIKELQAENKWTDTLILTYFVQGTKVGYPVVKPITASKIQFNVLQWNAKAHIAENNTGEMTMQFKCSKEAKIIHYLEKSSTGEKLHHYTCCQLIDDNGIYVKYNLNVIFPEEGLWKIELYNCTSDNKISLLMEYCVHATIGLSDQCYPCVKSDKILLSPCEKIYSPKPPNTLLSIPFQTTSMLSLTGYICELPKSLHCQQEELCNRTYVSQEGINKYQLNAVFPHSGRWKVGVYINEDISEKKIEIIEAFSIVTVVGIVQCDPCSVYAQLTSTAAKFKITIPNTPTIITLHEPKPICIKFITPSDLLFSHDIVDESEGQHTPLEDYTLLDTPDNKTSPYCMKAVLPHQGNWLIQLYATDEYKEDMHTISYNQVLYLRVNNVVSDEEYKYNVFYGYPKLYPISVYQSQFKLLEWNKPEEEYIAKNKVGTMEIVFSVKQNVDITHCIVKGIEVNGNQHLYKKSSTGEKLHHYTCCQLIDDNGIYVKYNLNVIFPEEGLWKIELYNCTSDNKISLLMEYCVHATIGLSDQCYPCVKSDKILLSPCEKIYSPKPPNTLLSIPFQTTSMLSLTGYICELPKSLHCQQEELCNRTYVSQEGINKYQLNAVFPHSGRWKVGVYINEDISEKKIEIIEAFSIVTVVGIVQCDPCSVYAQLTSTAAKFKITIPNTPTIITLHEPKPICIKFITPSDLLFSHDIVDESEGQHTPLEDYTLLDTPDNKTSPYCMKAVLPHQGNWLIQLYATDEYKEDMHTISYNQVLYLRVNNVVSDEEYKYNVFYRYPKLYPISVYRSQFKLLEWNNPEEEYIAENKVGTMEIIFSVKQNVDITHCIVKGKEDNENQRLCKFTCLNPVKENSVNTKQTLKVLFTEEDYWTILLFQNGSALMEYTIHATVAVKGKSFPIITPKFSTYGLQIPPSSVPYLSFYNLPVNTKIELYCPDHVSLEAIVQNKKKNFNASISEGNILVKISECGTWIIELYASGQNCDAMQLVLTHEIITI